MADKPVIAIFFLYFPGYPSVAAITQHANLSDHSIEKFFRFLFTQARSISTKSVFKIRIYDWVSGFPNLAFNSSATGPIGVIIIPGNKTPTNGVPIVLSPLRLGKTMGRPFVGVLFPGIMITPMGPVALELNARFGNPETQSYMRILKTDLVDILLACVNKNLKNFSIEWSDKFACCVMAATEGYPGKYKKNIAITGLSAIDSDSDVVIFQAGTKIIGSDMVVGNMGRALGASALGNNLNVAIGKAYKALDKIKFDGMQFRTDIGKEALIPPK